MVLSSAFQKLLFLLVRLSVFLINGLGILAALSLPALAELPEELYEQGSKYVKAALVSDHTTVQPSKHDQAPITRVGVLLRVEPGWHIYWKNSGEAALPTKVTWQFPAGWRTGDLQWPLAQRFLERGDITTFGYKGEVLLFADLFSAVAKPEKDTPVLLKAKVTWLVCKDICIPGKAIVEKEIVLSSSGPARVSEDAAKFEKYAALIPAELSPESLPKKFPSFGLTAILSQEIAVPKQSLTGALLLEGLPETDLLAENLQVFPYATQHITIGIPEVAPLDSKKLPVQPESFLVTFPIKVSSEAKGNKTYSLGGVLAFSSTLTQEKHDWGIEWSLPVSVTSAKQPPPITPQFEGISKTAGSFSPLTFRLISYKDIPVEKSYPEPPKAPSASILIALVCAFIGGILLNLMPCVLPIISIKVMSFVDAVDQPRSKTIGAALAFSLGIICSFLALAVLVIALRAAGHQLGWGFQFQHPEFVIVLTLVVYLLGLGFFDVYAISLPFMPEANRSLSRLSPGPVKHFFDGILATALSTPCTAPFLGTALVFAFSQPPLFTVLIFLAIGLGLALPYAYLSTHPKLLRLLPAPGPWMYRLRELMGFLLLGTVVWLLFILNRLTEEGAVWTVALMLLIYLFFWLYKWSRETGGAFRMFLVAALSFFLGLLFVLHTYPRMVDKRTDVSIRGTGVIQWEPYSDELLERARIAHTPLFIDFTADWCLTCKANELLTIETDRVARALKEYGITPVKADWTTGDERITKALRRFGGGGVPLYVVIPANPDQEPIVLPTLPSKGTLIQAFKKGSMKSE